MRGLSAAIMIMLVLALVLIFLEMMPEATITAGGCVPQGLGSEIAVIDKPSDLEVQRCGSITTMQMPAPNDRSIEFSISCQGNQQSFIPALFVRDWSRSPEVTIKPIYYRSQGATVPRLQGSQYFNSKGEIEVFQGALATREVTGWTCSLNDVHTTVLSGTSTPSIPQPIPGPISGTPVSDRIPVVSDIWDLVSGIFNSIVAFVAIPFLPP